MNTENRYTFLKAIYDELEKAEKNFALCAAGNSRRKNDFEKYKF